MEVRPVFMDKKEAMKKEKLQSTEQERSETVKSSAEADSHSQEGGKSDSVENVQIPAEGDSSVEMPAEDSAVPAGDDLQDGEEKLTGEGELSEETDRAERTENAESPEQVEETGQAGKPETGDSEDSVQDERQGQETVGDASPVKHPEPLPQADPPEDGKKVQPVEAEVDPPENGGKVRPKDTEAVEIIEGRKAGNSKTAFLVSMLLVIGILAGIYYYGYKYCASHFMPGTLINGYDCGGLTEEEVEKKFSDAADDYVLNVRFRGGSTEIIHAKDMGFEYKPDGSIAVLLQQQDKLVWPKYFFEDSLYEIKPGGNYDDELLTAALQNLPELQEDNMEKPVNAYIEFESGNDQEDGKFVIRPETAGSWLDIVQLTAGVGDAAARYSEIVDVEEIAGAYVEASLKSNDARIVARCNDLNDLVGASITYELPDGNTMRLNSDVTKDWLVKDDSGKLVKDEKIWDEKLWEFLEQLAYNTNTIGMDRQFNSTLRGMITVSGGDYGYMVNQITEHDKLVEDFKKQTKETRKPDYYITPYNEQTENDGIGNTYIEADLSAQHIWCYVDGQLVVESDCVSGDTTTGHATPTGVFGIMFMLRDTTLRGVMQSNGKYEYETKVGYWMPFYDGCGFHDAWWRTAFGGNIYQGDGSHGCINLPVDAAQQLYSYCDDKMPVVVYW